MIFPSSSSKQIVGVWCLSSGLLACSDGGNGPNDLRPRHDLDAALAVDRLTQEQLDTFCLDITRRAESLPSSLEDACLVSSVAFSGDSETCSMLMNRCLEDPDRSEGPPRVLHPGDATRCFLDKPVDCPLTLAQLDSCFNGIFRRWRHVMDHATCDDAGDHDNRDAYPPGPDECDVVKVTCPDLILLP